MGKGDKKTRRGKIARGSFGVLRRRNKKTGTVITAKKSSAKIATPNETATGIKSEVKKSAGARSKTTDPKVATKKAEPII